MNQTETPTKLYLKDVPLTTRGNRIYVRNTINEYRDRFEAMFTDFLSTGGEHTLDEAGNTLTFSQWMVKAQGVNVPVLDEMQAIDELPVDKYVDAVVAYKQAVARAHHAKLVEENRTLQDLDTWCQDVLKVPFADVGRAEALEEVSEWADDDDDDGYVWERNTKPRTVIVRAEGALFERGNAKHGISHFNQISPYAIDLIRFLNNAGWNFFMLVDDEESIDLIQDHLTFQGVQPRGYITFLRGNGIVDKADILNPEQVELQSSYEVHHVLSDLIPSGNRIDISGMGVLTYYWGDFVNQLMNDQYMNEEDVNKLWKNLLSI